VGLLRSQLVLMPCAGLAKQAKPGETPSPEAVRQQWHKWVAARDAHCAGHPWRYSKHQLSYHYTQGERHPRVAQCHECHRDCAVHRRRPDAPSIMSVQNVAKLSRLRHAGVCLGSIQNAPGLALRHDFRLSVQTSASCGASSPRRAARDSRRSGWQWSWSCRRRPCAARY